MVPRNSNTWQSGNPFCSFGHGIATYEAASTVRLNCTGTARNNSSSIILTTNTTTTNTLRAFCMYTHLPSGALRTRISSAPPTSASFARPTDGCCNRYFVRRRSTIGIHPDFSEALSLEELHTSPGHWLQQKSNCLPMNNPMAQVYKIDIFRNKIGSPTILAEGTPSFRKYVSGNVLSLYRIERVFGHFCLCRLQVPEGLV